MGGRGSAGGVGTRQRSLPELTGTVKQINWAKDIRDDFIRNIGEAEALLRWWEKNSSEQEENVIRLRADAEEGKDGALSEYNRLEGNAVAVADAIGDRIRSLNTLVHLEGRSPNRLSEKGQQLESEYGEGMIRYKPRLKYRSDKGYSRAVERRKNQKEAAREIIATAKSYARQEQSAEKWIARRDYVKKRKVKVSGKKILWDVDGG